MLFALTLDIENRLFGIGLGLFVGSLVTWLLTWWRLVRARRSILKGDAGDMIVIEHHIVERNDTPDRANLPIRLRRRYLGQSTLATVIPNLHLALDLQARAGQTTERNALISMEGAAGSYLLESLCGFVCDRVAECLFDHEFYVMAVCREPASLTFHKPICVILITVRDLELFLHWEKVSGIEVEHASDGIRIVTLMDLAKRWRDEQARITDARANGRSTRYLETMFLLDLALDPRAAPIPTRPVPWPRFGPALRERGLS